MSSAATLDDIPVDVFRGIVAFATGRFTVGRLDGGVKVCGPEHKAWSAHVERQSTARDIRALVGALGFHQLRCVSRRWRTTADEHLRSTHERIFGVRPLVAKPVDGRVAREDPSYWLRRLVLGTLEEAAPWGKLPKWERDAGPDGNDDDYHYQEPPSDELAAPWNAARYEVGTGPLDDSTPVLAVARRARACLSWRSSLCSFARFGCCGHGTRFRESLAYTGFFGNAAGLPWRLDAHHVYIDRTAWDHDEQEICAEIGEGFEFVTRHEDGKEVEDIRALINHAQSLLPDVPRLRIHYPPRGQVERVDLVGGPNHFLHKYDEATRSTEAVLFDTDFEWKQAECCSEAPSTVVEGACLFSFRPNPADVCRPDRWRESPEWEDYHEAPFGTLRRRGGRAWRVSSCEPPRPAFNNADVFLDEVVFEPGCRGYDPCENCDTDCYAAHATAAGATVHLVFRVLTPESGGRLASEISRSRARSNCKILDAFSAYRLVMSGTVRGLPVLTPVRGPASDDENTAFHEGLKAWKKADLALRNQLPPCDKWNESYRRRGMKDPSDPFWSEPPCECERCRFEADHGRDREFVRLQYSCGDGYGDDVPKLRLGRACDKVLAQLPFKDTYGLNPSLYGKSKTG